MVATKKNIVALAILTGLLGLSVYFIYKEFKQAPKTTATGYMNQFNRNKPLDGLGVGKSYTFPRNSSPRDASFVKEV